MAVNREEKARRLADIRVMSDEEFAWKYRITPEWAKKFRQKNGIFRPKVTLADAVPAGVKRKVCEMRRGGGTLREIARAAGISDWTVRAVLREGGFDVYLPAGRGRRKGGAPGGSGKGPQRQEPAAACVTPETAIPCYYGGRPDTCELEEAERRRYEELKRWKEAAFFREIENSRLRGGAPRSCNTKFNEKRRTTP